MIALGVTGMMSATAFVGMDLVTARADGETAAQIIAQEKTTAVVAAASTVSMPAKPVQAAPQVDLDSELGASRSLVVPDEAEDAGVDVLNPNDPRWGKAHGTQQASALAPRAARKTEAVAAAVLGDRFGPDQEKVAAVVATAHEAEAAEDIPPVGQVLALQSPEVAAVGVKPAAPPAVEPEDDDDPPAAGGTKVSVNHGVNMRGGPSNRHRVLRVIPRGAVVDLIGSCQHWCRIVYEGRRGYIYKSFIGRSQAADSGETRARSSAVADDRFDAATRKNTKSLPGVFSDTFVKNQEKRS